MKIRVSSFRKHLDITQTQMADLLGCKRSQVAMVELGHRSLPQTSERIFYRLEELKEHTVGRTQAASSAALKNGKAAEPPGLSKKIRTMSLRHAQLAMAIDELENKMLKAQQAQNLAETLLQHPASFNDNQQLAITIIMRKAAQRYARYNHIWIANTIEMTGLMYALEKAKTFMP